MHDLAALVDQKRNDSSRIHIVIQIQNGLGHLNLLCVDAKPPLHDMPLLWLGHILPLSLPSRAGGLCRIPWFEEAVLERQLDCRGKLGVPGKPRAAKFEIKPKARGATARHHVIQILVLLVLNQLSIGL